MSDTARRGTGRSERLAEPAAQRTDATTPVVEEAEARLMIDLASVSAEVARGLEVWREAGQRGDGKTGAETLEDRSRRLAPDADPGPPTLLEAVSQR